MKLPLLITALAGCAFAQTAPTGEGVYAKVCANCHGTESSHAPPIEALRSMSAQRILNTLDFGSMMSVTGMLTRAEREAVSSYLGSASPARKLSASAFCADRKVTVANAPKVAWNGWSPSASNTRYQAASGLSIEQVKHLKLKWAFGYDGDVNAFAAPAMFLDSGSAKSAA